MLLKALTNTKSTSSTSMPHLNTKMRSCSLIFLLLAWVLLSASQRHSYNKITVQAIETVELQPEEAGSRSYTRKVLPTWIERKKIRKTPSGPNPVGNQYPPSRH